MVESMMKEEGTVKKEYTGERVPTAQDIALLADALNSARDETMPVEHAYDFIKYHYDNNMMMADHYLEQIQDLRKERAKYDISGLND